MTSCTGVPKYHYISAYYKNTCKQYFVALKKGGKEEKINQRTEKMKTILMVKEYLSKNDLQSYNIEHIKKINKIHCANESEEFTAFKEQIGLTL